MIPTLNLRMFRNSVSVTALAAWAFIQPAPAADASRFTETVIHSFCSQPNCADGEAPIAGLIDVKGMLYGTTTSGGSSGDGTVFALDPNTGAETVLYSFCSQQNCIDGAVPTSSLIDVRGTLYGVTLLGGATNTCGPDGDQGCGTVFAVDPETGTEKLLYSFCNAQNCADGDWPEGGLIDVGGTLYGTTYFGGTYGGTVFALDPHTGAETVVHSFCSQQNCPDGGGPRGNLIEVNGSLYGTTFFGGGNASSVGTVFAFNPATGSETTVYSFCSQQNCADGAEPLAGLIAVNGTLYGTTTEGGAHSVGTVFALDPNTGAETVVYSFCSKTNCKDGSYPQSSLIDVRGKLYGTAPYDGAHGCSNTCGTVFSVDLTTNAETVVYQFCSQQNCADGGTPESNLTDVKGTLYGTTSYGGANCTFCGVVFALTKR